jgi:hypothetical protein
LGALLRPSSNNKQRRPDILIHSLSKKSPRNTGPTSSRGSLVVMPKLKRKRTRCKMTYNLKKVLKEEVAEGL